MNIQSYSTPLSFTSMKPNQFKGFDYACIRKFKAPVEKFNSISDFNKWALDRFTRVHNQNWRARDDEITIQRYGMIEEWTAFLLKNISIPSICLIILSAITKDLKNTTDKIPPIISETSIKETIKHLETNLEHDKDYQFDFNKLYTDTLKKQLLNNEETKTGWIIIPSQFNAPNDFETNLQKLKLLSAKTWCTKGPRAESYLSAGDFHLYLKNGQAKYCLKFEGNSIIEIQNENNNSIIDYQCFNEINSYIQNNHFNLAGTAAFKYKEAQNKFKFLMEIKDQLNSAIKNNNAEEIFFLLGYNPQKLKDGSLSIEEYRQPSENFSFSDLGIDENSLLAVVKEIRTNAHFEDSKAVNLGAVKYIGGDLDLCNSCISSTGGLEKVEGDVIFNNSMVKDIPSLKEIGGSAYFEKSLITDLHNIEKIGKSLYLNPATTSLGKLKSIGRDVNFTVNSLSLGNLESIGGDTYIGAGVYSLGKLKEIGGDLDIADYLFSDTGNLEVIKGYIFINPKGTLSEESFNNTLAKDIIKTEDIAF